MRAADGGRAGIRETEQSMGDGGANGPIRNWAGNITFRADRLERPRSLDELRRLVGGASQLRVLGSGHSFNPVADVDSPAGTLVSLDALPRTVEPDTAAGTVRVAAGVRYAELAEQLHKRGLALANLASLPHITVAGSVATGTHGSGDANQGLAAAVRAVELVAADGSELTLRQGEPDFDGAVVALGALGAVTHLELAVQPGFQVAQYVRTGLELEAAVEHFDAITGAAYSVSLFTDWTAPVFRQVLLKQRSDEGAAGAAGAVDFPWAPAAPGAMHPVPGISPEHCTPQDGVPGPWHERLPHFRPEFTPSAGEELQSEYLVPRRYAAQALRAVAGVREAVAPVLQICEVRTIAGDEQWLSPAYGGDMVGLHFTWRPDQDGVAPVLALLERELAPFAARPHWGKLFCTEPSVVRGRYPRAEAFTALARRLDPAGKLRNAFLDRLLFG